MENLYELNTRVKVLVKSKILRGRSKHLTNGSPVWSGLQLQIGLWLMVSQRDSMPQVPGQGSEHFMFKHARFVEHSWLERHSGRQFGGFPINSARHEQVACPFETRHWLFGPQGDGTQGFSLSGSEHENFWTIQKNIYDDIRRAKSQVFVTFEFTEVIYLLSK